MRGVIAPKCWVFAAPANGAIPPIPHDKRDLLLARCRAKCSRCSSATRVDNTNKFLARLDRLLSSATASLSPTPTKRPCTAAAPTRTQRSADAPCPNPHLAIQRAGPRSSRYHLRQIHLRPGTAELGYAVTATGFPESDVPSRHPPPHRQRWYRQRSRHRGACVPCLSEHHRHRDPDGTDRLRMMSGGLTYASPCDPRLTASASP